ncbi:MAG: hypothetical protein AB1416_04825 [Actinomycetota bacterium]
MLDSAAAPVPRPPEDHLDIVAGFVWFALGVATAILCHRIAVTKGRNANGWAVAGFLIPVVTLIVLLVAPAAQSGDPA